MHSLKNYNFSNRWQVATFEFPPAIMYQRVKGQPPHLYGRDVEVVRALAVAGNFVINFTQVPPGKYYANSYLSFYVLLW